MNTDAITLRKRWLAMGAVAILAAIALAAGTLFAASDRQQPDIQPSSGQLPSEPLTNHETDPGLTGEYRALVPQDAADQDGPGAAPGQVVPEPQVSDALAQWLDEQPEQMGFITREDAITSDPDTMDWLLYQAVHKDVLTQEEANAIQTWYDQRPSTEEAPELLEHQPAYLDRPGDQSFATESLMDAEAR